MLSTICQPKLSHQNKLVFAANDQPLLLQVGQLFDSRFLTQGSGFVRYLLTVDHLHRTAAAGTSGCRTCIVLRQTALRVVGNAGVESIIRAAQDVYMPVLFHILTLRSRGARCAPR